MAEGGQAPSLAAEPAAVADPALAHWESLADQIQASDQHGASEQDGTAAAAAASVSGPASGPLVRDCWEQALDLNSGHCYWFNRATGVRQWHPPAGWPGAEAGAWQACATPPAATAKHKQGQPAEGGTAGGAGPHDWRQAGAEPSPAEAAPASEAEAAAAAGEAGGAQPPAQQQQQQQPAGQPAAGQGEHSGWQYEPGLYYRDAMGQLQGPFTLEQLRQWRGMLPLDLPVLELRPPPGSSGSCGRGDASAADAAAEAGSAAPASGTKQATLPSSGNGGGSRRSVLYWEQHQLAALLGDGDLLERWRLQNPEQAAWPGAAPPAGAYEAELQRGSAHSLAEAVLDGLPAHDEAVEVARVAAAAGRSIQEVVEWSRSRGGGDYTATAYRVAARGRVQAGGGQESLYAEAASWANPHQLEQQLTRAAERRKRGLTGGELRVVRQRKQELKEKKRTAWLYT